MSCRLLRKSNEPFHILCFLVDYTHARKKGKTKMADMTGVSEAEGQIDTIEALTGRATDRPRTETNGESNVAGLGYGAERLEPRNARKEFTIYSCRDHMSSRQP